MTQHIGTFELKSTKLRVTDPCYDKDTWCSGVLENALPGIWKAFITTEPDSWSGGKWDIVSELTVIHSEFIHNPRLSSWKLTNIDVGVDSGQAGFFDDEFYPKKENNGEYGNLNTFYGKVCNLTCGTEESNGGTLEFGAVSSSGCGDGSYQCFIIEDKNNNVVAAKIVFISDEDEEDDIEEESWIEEELENEGIFYNY
jgi:hypothetical protein